MTTTAGELLPWTLKRGASVSAGKARGRVGCKLSNKGKSTAQVGGGTRRHLQQHGDLWRNEKRHSRIG